MNYFRVLTPFDKSGTFPQIQVNPVYFNRQDVKAAIHAPVNVQWTECNSSVFVGPGDTSPPSALDVLPRVMKHGVPVVVVTGLADYVILSEGYVPAYSYPYFV
jgi:carboxypeptidase D